MKSDTKLSKPKTISGDLHNLPAALAPLIALPHWVMWRWQKAKDKWTKVPYQPNGKTAENNNPKTWNSYDDAIKVIGNGKFDGIGFCILGSDIEAFDIDNCREPDNGSIDPWAMALVEKANSYTEITVSGTGLRIIGRGNGPRVQRKLPVNNKVSCEIYRKCERYIVMTGNPLPNTPQQLANLDTIIDATHAELLDQK